MADLHARPIQPLLFDPDHDPLTTQRLDFVYHSDFVAEAQRPQLNNYIRHAQIGRGQHGSVYLCHRIDPTLPIGDPNRRIPVAMKSVRRVSARADKMQQLQRTDLPKSDHTTVADKIRTKERQIKREIAIMKKLRHPHVVRLYEIIDDRLREKIYIVMEYLGGGEIKWHDEDHRPVLTVAQSRRILRDAVLGLEYLHRQGIIHRDIKPANMFWTDDRRQVKIGDFGVSHFCYAQQLGEGGANAPPRDPLFQNDVELTRHAGTPSFLAPELVYEYSYNPLSKKYIYVDDPMKGPTVGDGERTNDDKRSDDPGPSRPPKPKITPAIDIWALGVTLYCLLFGNTPFLAYTEGQQNAHEYRLYNMICNADWQAPLTMGYDRLPTGGRHPTGNSEGAEIIELLDQFLQKDYRNRITLEQVMAYPWVVRDLVDINRWRQTNHHPEEAQQIHVSTTETKGAMSTVHFRWRWGSQLARHVSSLFRGVRPSSVTRAEPDNGVGVVSDPGLSLMVRDRVSTSGRNSESKRGRDAKGKGRASEQGQQTKALKRPLSKSSKSLRATSTERWLNSRPNAMSTSALSSTASTPTTVVPISTPVSIPSSRSTKPQSRRGSDSRTVMSSTTEGASSGPSSPTSLGVSEREREGRMRFMSLFHIANWRPTKFPVRGVPRNPPGSPAGAGATYTTHTQLALQPQPGATHVTVLTGGVGAVAGAAPRTMVGGPNTRRSEEALRNYRHDEYGYTYAYAQNSSGGVSGAGAAYGPPLNGMLTAARRASSWGQGDKEEYTEMVSVKSVEQGLNEQEMLVGAGGVFRGGSTLHQNLLNSVGGQPGPSGVRHGEEVLMDVMMPDPDEEIDSDEERARRAREPRVPRPPLVYGPLEQAEDNMRFGQPAYNKTPSLDGDEDDDDRHSYDHAHDGREAERRREGAVVEQLRVRVHNPINVLGNHDDVGGRSSYDQESESKPGSSRDEHEHEHEHEASEQHHRGDDFYEEDDDDDDDDDDEALMVRRPSKRF